MTTEVTTPSGSFFWLSGKNALDYISSHSSAEIVKSFNSLHKEVYDKYEKEHPGRLETCAIVPVIGHPIGAVAIDAKDNKVDLVATLGFYIVDPSLAIPSTCLRQEVLVLDEDGENIVSFASME